MPDARIRSLETWGLEVVPGYTVDPKTGHEDERWRERYWDWHREVTAFRVDSQVRCVHDEAYRNFIDGLCKTDAAFFALHWMEIEEPRAMARGNSPPKPFDPFNLDDTFEAGAIDDYQKIHPFIPYAYQVQGMSIFRDVVLGAYRSQMLNVLWDKARGVGFTYAMLLAAYHAWLYYSIRGTILTEKWDKADKTHSLNTLFGKLDLFFGSTPAHLIPEGWDRYDRVKGTMHNPATGAIISTEPPTETATRSGREAYVMIDEGAFQEYLKELVATALGTTLHLLLWSTASWKMGHQWQNMVDEARKDKTGTTHLVEIDWYEHPSQDKAWETEKRATYQAAGIIEEFEVEYLRNASAGYTTLIYKTQVDKCPIVSEWYDPHRPLYISVDPGIADPTAWVFWQTYFKDGKKRIRVIDSYEIPNMPVEFHAHLITGLEPRPPKGEFEGDIAWPLWAEGFFGETELYFMEWLRTVPPAMVSYYGDPAILVKDYSHESFAIKINEITADIREAAGIEPIPVFPLGASWQPLYKRNNFHERRTGARKALMYTEFSDTDGALLVRDALAKTRRQEMTEKSVTAPGHIHDRHSHRVQAFEFGMIWETLELTEAELMPEKEARPEPIGKVKRIRGLRSAYQKQTRSLMGVA